MALLVVEFLKGAVVASVAGVSLFLEGAFCEFFLTCRLVEDRSLSTEVVSLRWLGILFGGEKGGVVVLGCCSKLWKETSDGDDRMLDLF